MTTFLVYKMRHYYLAYVSFSGGLHLFLFINLNIKLFKSLIYKQFCYNNIPHEYCWGHGDNSLDCNDMATMLKVRWEIVKKLLANKKEG